jgi:hypothetical protein
MQTTPHQRHEVIGLLGWLSAVLACARPDGSQERWGHAGRSVLADSTLLSRHSTLLDGGVNLWMRFGVGQ